MHETPHPKTKPVFYASPGGWVLNWSVFLYLEMNLTIWLQEAFSLCWRRTRPLSTTRPHCSELCRCRNILFKTFQMGFSPVPPCPRLQVDQHLRYEIKEQFVHPPYQNGWIFALILKEPSIMKQLLICWSLFNRANDLKLVTITTRLTTGTKQRSWEQQLGSSSPCLSQQPPL